MRSGLANAAMEVHDARIGSNFTGAVAKGGQVP
jgi:hypothetical protein